MLRLCFALLLCNSALAQGLGDAERGKSLYANQCIACHSLDVNLAGPRHRGVFGRRIAALADFEYSSALLAKGGTWNEQKLDEWLRNPKEFVPGSKMGYSVSDPQERMHIIAYLRSLQGP